MPSSKNSVVVACAGSGKTTRLVADAQQQHERRTGVITYTHNNTRELISRFARATTSVPAHVDVMTWYAFLLRECVRPYQGFLYPTRRIESIAFVNQRSAPYARESDTCRHYLAGENFIYSDKISKFVVRANAASNGLIVDRLAAIYSSLLIDEFQDLAGWDLDVIALLLRSGIRITMVGDPRQHVYSTNPAQKNEQYLGTNVIRLLDAWAKQGLCTIEQMNVCHRSNQAICDFANALWPGMDPMRAASVRETGHDGVFLVSTADVTRYAHDFQPQALRHDKNSETHGLNGINFGTTKGLEFPRTLLFPTTPIARYLKTGDLRHVENARERLHVAVTRAVHSVAFVTDDASPIVSNRWRAGGPA